MSLKGPLVDLTSSAAAVRKTGQGHQAEHQPSSPEHVATQSASTAAEPQNLGPEDPGVEHTLSWFGNRFSEDPQYLGETAGGTDLIDEARFTEEGKVHRHAWRGPFSEDAKEIKRREDSHAWCGNRNPSALQASWPKLWNVMSGVAALLVKKRAAHPELQNLTATFGEDPSRQPPP